MVSKSEIRAKKYLFHGILFGALFGFVGSFLVTTLFRFTDELVGERTLFFEGLYLAVATIVFISLIYVFNLLIRDLDKKSK